MDRLKALEIFRAVADKGSFVRAADSLNLSTAAVSRSVQELEGLLGVRLLQRSTRRVSLTAEGEGVLARARALIESFDDLAAASSAAAHEVAGDIRFTAPLAYGALRLAPALAGFMARHPRVRVDLQLSDAPLNLVDEGLDLALRLAWELPDSLIARRVGEARIGVFAAPAYLQAHGTPKHPDDLAQHDGLIFTGSGRASPWPFRHPVTHEHIAASPRPALSANHAEALLAAAIHGSGLALLPWFLAEAAVLRGELQPVLSQWTSPPLGVFLAYGSRQNQPLRVRKLIDHLVDALAAPQTEPAERATGMLGRSMLPEAPSPASREGRALAQRVAGLALPSPTAAGGGQVSPV